MNKEKIFLGVNIDHVATIRQARRTHYPNIVEAAEYCLKGGAHSITIHLREDRRHIQDDDLFHLKEWHKLPLNLEMANAQEIVNIALKAKPEEVCIVPEKRHEVTTEGGLNAAGEFNALLPNIKALQERGIIVSLFIDPSLEQVHAAAKLKAPFIELHTGSFCNAKKGSEEARKELDHLIEAAKLAHSLGLNVNAGHGINLENIDDILKIPHLKVLNIGHSIVARAVFVGLEEAVREMIRAMEK